MGARRKKGTISDGCLFSFIFIVGGATFLIMTMPLVFFLLVLPLTIMVIVKFIKWLKK